MNIAHELERLQLRLAQAEVMDAEVTEDTLSVDLMDGRTITVPLVWFPRLVHGTIEERHNFTLLRDGSHWPELDEDISVQTLLLGRGLGESSESLERWLEQRRTQHSPAAKQVREAGRTLSAAT